VLARGDDLPDHPVTLAREPSATLARGSRPPEPRDVAGPPGASAGTAAALPAAWRHPMWLVNGGLLLILAFLTVNVLAGGPLVGADQRIRAAVQARATSVTWRWLSDSWHAPAQLLVDLGYYQLAIPILAVCALAVVAKHRTLRPLLAAFVGSVLLFVTVVPAKIIIARPGPGLTTVGAGGLGVFPSGHTTTSSVCLGLAVLLLLPDLPPRIRWIAVAVLAGLCFLVGIALVWCDYHWFTDVVAGWALAALIVQASLWLSRASWPRWARGRE
jgi:membrane-associated phospholipid phosphatase